MKTVLTIAGSDSSGGAGVQADLKTFSAHGVYGMTAITALTAQNTLGVHNIHTPPASFIAEQIDAIFDDIRPDSVKIGMLVNAEIIDQVADRLSAHKASNIVLDPVMVASSGDTLLSQRAVATLIDRLLPNVDIITPNLPELFTLLKKAVPLSLSKSQIEQHAYALQTLLGLNNLTILVKGGHQLDTHAKDFLLTPKNNTEQTQWLELPTITTNNTHGTGCTLSAAIAANLSLGKSMLTSVQDAKKYLQLSLSSGLSLGRGHGPLKHNVKLP